MMALLPTTRSHSSHASCALVHGLNLGLFSTMVNDSTPSYFLRPSPCAMEFGSEVVGVSPFDPGSYLLSCMKKPKILAQQSKAHLTAPVTQM